MHEVGGGGYQPCRRRVLECIYVWGGRAICRDGGGGWKQNRTALTTEPKDKEKIGLADSKDCLGAWSCFMKGDRNTSGNQRLSEENTSLTQALLLSLPLEITHNIYVQVDMTSLCVCVCLSAPSTGRNESEDISLEDLPSPSARACFCVRVCVFSSTYLCVKCLSN